MRRAIAATALFAAGIGVALAGRPVRESLASVAVRAQRIVVAEVVAVDDFDEGGERILDVEAVPEQLMAGPALESGDEETLLCRYTEQRVQRRGDAVLSPLVSGSGEEFRARRGDRVILLISMTPEAETAAPAAEASASGEPDDVDAPIESPPAAPVCRLLRIESLQNRIAILRHLRHAAEAQQQRP
ncbi:MAG TPA: hypothetical protein VLF18_21435 [Tahibacter sp.]|uniref:hypothetical protein n=1 Tax=Tahibacter sp. TaxID=2056211 RepID=UPI002BE0039F|nr:hypothetical protein [Tahibacter sp.]HSX62754.1 hypothetical protein [Tahibacter sp.]